MTAKIILCAVVILVFLFLAFVGVRYVLFHVAGEEYTRKTLIHDVEDELRFLEEYYKSLPSEKAYSSLKVLANIKKELSMLESGIKD